MKPVDAKKAAEFVTAFNALCEQHGLAICTAGEDIEIYTMDSEHRPYTVKEEKHPRFPRLYLW